MWLGRGWWVPSSIGLAGCTAVQSRSRTKVCCHPAAANRVITRFLVWTGNALKAAAYFRQSLRPVQWWLPLGAGKCYRGKNPLFIHILHREPTCINYGNLSTFAWFPFSIILTVLHPIFWLCGLELTTSKPRSQRIWSLTPASWGSARICSTLSLSLPLQS